MVRDPAGIASSILNKAGVDASRVAEIAAAEIGRLPPVTGDGVGPQSGPAVMEVLSEAEKEAGKLSDAYISTEHLLLALWSVKSQAGEVLTASGLDRERLLEAIRALRKASGVENITDPAAESTFEALKKFGIDLMEQAQAGTVMGGIELVNLP